LNANVSINCEAVSDREGQACSPHQHNLLDLARLAGGQSKCERPPKAVANETGTANADCVHERTDMANPYIHIDVSKVSRAIRIAKAHHIRREDMKMLGKRRGHAIPVGKGGDAGAGPVDQDQRRTGAISRLDIIGADAIGGDGFADFWVGHFDPSFTTLSSRR
jgi:hypothetical protein